MIFRLLRVVAEGLEQAAIWVDRLSWRWWRFQRDEERRKVHERQIAKWMRPHAPLSGEDRAFLEETNSRRVEEGPKEDQGYFPGEHRYYEELEQRFKKHLQSQDEAIAIFDEAMREREKRRRK